MCSLEPIVLLKDKFQIRIIFIIMNIYDENPEFSPDGEKIIWNTAAGGNPGEGEELWLMNADGSNKVRLTYFTDPSHEEYDPNARQITESAWSPDGKKIVFGHVSQEERGGIHSLLLFTCLLSSPQGLLRTPRFQLVSHFCKMIPTLSIRQPRFASPFHIARMLP